MPRPPENAAKTFMNNNDKSQITNGQKGRLLNSRAFSAVWGRVLGLALLMLSAVPFHAATRAILDGDNARTGKFSADLQQRATGANDMVTVIVQYRHMPTISSLK